MGALAMCLVNMEEKITGITKPDPLSKDLSWPGLDPEVPPDQFIPDLHSGEPPTTGPDQGMNLPFPLTGTTASFNEIRIPS